MSADFAGPDCNLDVRNYVSQVFVANIEDVGVLMG